MPKFFILILAALGFISSYGQPSLPVGNAVGPCKVLLSNGETRTRYEGSDSVIEVIANGAAQKVAKPNANARRALLHSPTPELHRTIRAGASPRSKAYPARNYTGTLTCRALVEKNATTDAQKTFTVTVSIGEYTDMSNVPVTFNNMYGFATITGILDYSTRTFYMPSGQSVSSSPSYQLYAMSEDHVYYSGQYNLTGHLSSDGTTIVMDGYGGYNGFFLNSTSYYYLYMNNVITLPVPITIDGVYPPVITPSGGQFVGTQEITISSATADAVIHYQLDNAGEWLSLDNGGSISIDDSHTVTAYAAVGDEVSATRSETYTRVTPNALALNDDELSALNFQTNYAVINDSLQLVDRAYTTRIGYSDLTREKILIENFWGFGLLNAEIAWTSPGEGVLTVPSQQFLTYNRYSTSQRYDWYVIAPTSINDGIVREYDEFVYNDDYVVLGSINKNELWLNDHCVMAVSAFVGETNTAHGPVYGNSVLRTRFSSSQALHRFRGDDGNERSHRISIEQDLTHQLDETSPYVITKVVGLNGYGGETTLRTYLPENSSELIDGYDNLATIEVTEGVAARWFYPAYPNDVTNSQWYDFQYHDANGNAIVGAYSNSNKEFVWNEGELTSSIGRLESTTENRINIDNDFEAYGVGPGALSPALRQGSIQLSSPVATWNDSTISKEFVLSGTYFSIANRPGTIYYAVSSGGWQTTGLNLDSGSDFSLKVSVAFPANEAVHTLRLVACDNTGLYSKYNEVEFHDVKAFQASGVFNRSYTGRPVELPDFSLADPSTGETLAEGTHYDASYVNNRNAGTASIVITGIYPYSVGRDTLHFEISPVVMDAQVAFEQESYVYSKDAAAIIPSVQVHDNVFGLLDPETDYTVKYANNTYPGTATVTVTAHGNFIGEATGSFEIERADICLEDFTYQVDRHTLYDGSPKQVNVHSDYPNFPEATITYRDKSSNEPSSGIEPGVYEIDIDFAQSRCFNAAHFGNVDSVTCKLLDEGDWNILKQFYQANHGDEWKVAWDMSDRKNAITLHGLTFDDNRVTDIKADNQQLSGGFPAMLLSLDKLQSLDLSHNSLTGDASESMSTYLSDMPVHACVIKHLDISYNDLSGNIGFLASAFPLLEDLDASHNHFEAVSPIIPSTVVSVNLVHQTLDTVLPLTVSDLIGDDLMSQLPSIISYNHDRQDFILPQLTLSEYPDDGDFVMTHNDGWTFASDYRGENGQTLELHSDNCTMPVSLSFAMGDATFDDMVNVLDLQAIINKIFGEYNYNFNWTAGNVIVDERLNVQDVVGEVNLLLASESNGAPRRDAPKRSDKLPESEAQAGADAYLYWHNNLLYLSSPRPVAALDITLNGNVTWDIAKYGLVTTTKDNHIVAYSLNGSTIPAGETAIAMASESIPEVLNAMLSDTDAQEIRVGYSAPGIITGLNSIKPADVNVMAADGGRVLIKLPQPLTDASWAVYSVNGRLVASGNDDMIGAGSTTLAHGLEAGVYLVRIATPNQPAYITKIAIIR